jgi:hypothetical protein
MLCTKPFIILLLESDNGILKFYAHDIACSKVTLKREHGSGNIINVLMQAH